MADGVKRYWSGDHVWESAVSDGYLPDRPTTSSRLWGVSGCRWQQTGPAGIQLGIPMFQWTATYWYDDVNICQIIDSIFLYSDDKRDIMRSTTKRASLYTGCYIKLI